VIVDGHHTLEAYKGAGKGETLITCEWFAGGVREAFAAIATRNIWDKLPVSKADKMDVHGRSC
jgi:hypothetical protein